MAVKSKFVYRGNERTSEEVEQRSRRSYSYDSIIIDGIPQWRPKEGENIIRVLPVSGGRHWELDIYQHYDIGVDGGSYLCLDKMLQEPCPICDARLDAADEDESKALRPSHRRICWIIDRNNEKAGPQLWNIPDQLFTDINSRAIDRKTGQPILIDDPEEGFDIAFLREGTKKENTKYRGVELMRDPTPIHDKEATQDKWLEYVADNGLKEMLEFKTADYLERILKGKVSRRQDAATGEGDEDTGRSRRAPRREPEPEAEEETTQARRRPRRGEEEPGPEAELTRPARRRAEPEEPAEEPEPAGRGSRRTARREEPEPEPEEESEPEKPTRPTRRPSRGEEDPPSEESSSRRVGGSVARRRPVDDTRGDPPESRTARAGLERLRPKR